MMELVSGDVMFVVIGVIDGLILKGIKVKGDKVEINMVVMCFLMYIVCWIIVFYDVNNKKKYMKG